MIIFIIEKLSYVVYVKPHHSLTCTVGRLTHSLTCTVEFVYNDQFQETKDQNFFTDVSHYRKILQSGRCEF